MQHKRIPLNEILKIISVYGQPEVVFASELDQGMTQTGFCYTEIPGVVALALDKYWLVMALKSPFVTCIITSMRTLDAITPDFNKPVLVYENPESAFYCLHNHGLHLTSKYEPPNSEGSNIAPSAQIHPKAIIEDGVSIGENVSIGAYSVLCRGTIVEAETRIHEHVTIGTTGLFTKIIGGNHQQITHFGGVRIGRGCHILTGVNMSRSVHHSTFTTIGDNVSCGIHANVSHDVRVGNSTTISSKVVLAGRAQIGANVWIGAGALISNGVKIGSRAKLRIGAVVIDDVPDNADFSGNFAIPHRKSLYEWANKSRIKIQ